VCPAPPPVPATPLPPHGVAAFPPPPVPPVALYMDGFSTPPAPPPPNNPVGPTAVSKALL